jgi:predicted  nucleic acid-binding Zn-ribbon protein
MATTQEIENLKGEVLKRKNAGTMTTGEANLMNAGISAISANNLQGQTPITFPTIPTDTTNYSGMLTPPAPTETTTKEEEPSWMKYITGSSAPTNPITAYNQAYGASGIEDKSKLVNDITSQLQAINAEATTQTLGLEDPTKMGGAISTSGFLNRQQQEVNRQAAIKALPLQAQLSAAQGNLTAATDKLNTLFKLQSDYDTQVYNYNKDLRDKVYQYATAEEKAKLDAQTKIEDRAYQEKQDAIKNAKAIAKEAMDNGQADIASQITALDPKSKTYTQDVANLQAKIVNPTAELDKKLKELQIQKAQQDLVPKATATTPEEIEIQKENQILGLQDKINTLDTLIKGDLPAVGTNIFSRGDPLTVFTGNTQNFIGSVQQLVSKDTLDTLINLKKAGGTLGALSDQERIMLQSAATKIGTWAIKDKVGNVLGYNINQKAFKDELKTIKNLTERALKASGGVPVTSYLDTVDSALNGTSNPYSVYNIK